jgi:UDP-N-acetylmuramoyl-L-alanyl-D-glutamate--2,6-diaminopimelate ligase
MWDFNIYNIMAAIGVFTALWIKSDKMHNIVENIEAVPWRLEAVENKDDFRIYVDYAHTADALTKVLEILEEHKWDGRLICVFWATWDRDKSKRPVMWRVVSKHSDIVFLTQDDDYTEVTENIIKDVLPGIERKEGEDFWVISDRAEAIRTALLTMKKGDTLLVAWKWDEHSLMTNEGPKEWHDRTFIESILKDIDENKMLD